MELLIQLFACLLAFVIALLITMKYAPNGLSEFELRRRAASGEKSALAEENRRILLPVLVAIRDLKIIIILSLLVWLLFATHEPVFAWLLTLIYLFVIYIIFAYGWLASLARPTQNFIEHFVKKHAKIIMQIFSWLAPKQQISDSALGIASRDELRAILADDTQLLSSTDKARLLGAFDFGSLLIADAMVPRDKIITVESSETVGPLLLDRLHKTKHNIYVVVKKNLDHIQGLLYMHDLTPIDPDIKEVTDATRPTVHYLPPNAPLQDVLSATLKTGRQLFIVAEDGKTQGLITLSDALKFLNGEPLPAEAPVTIKK